MVNDLGYQVMRIRMIEEEISRRYPNGKIRCPIHLCIGQEASAVGVCAALRCQDHVYGNHRSHGHYLAKGGNLRKFALELYGSLDGCSSGTGGSMHLIDESVGFMGSTPIVGGTIPVAVGDAWAAKLQGKDRITVVFFGDGAFEEGVVHESMNFAKLHSLPILFVCEDNGLAVNTKRIARSVADIRDVVCGHGLAFAGCHSGCVDDVYGKTQQLITEMGVRPAPAFLHVGLSLHCEHCGPGHIKLPISLRDTTKWGEAIGKEIQATFRGLE